MLTLITIDLQSASVQFASTITQKWEPYLVCDLYNFCLLPIKITTFAKKKLLTKLTECTHCSRFMSLTMDLRRSFGISKLISTYHIGN